MIMLLFCLRDYLRFHTDWCPKAWPRDFYEVDQHLAVGERLFFIIHQAQERKKSHTGTYLYENFLSLYVHLYVDMYIMQNGAKKFKIYTPTHR